MVLLFGDVKQLLRLLNACGLDHLSKVTVISGDAIVLIRLNQEPKWMIILDASAGFHYQDPICIDHSRKSVRNDHHSGRILLHELLSQLSLDEVVSLHVHIRCSFIEYEDLGLKKHCPAQTNKLLLSHRENTGAVIHIGLHTCRQGVDIVTQLDFLEDFLHLVICLLIEWIEILPYGALE